MVQVKEYDHSLKITSDVFAPIFLGDKTCLLMTIYDHTEAGTILRLHEWATEGHFFTGRECDVEVTHVEQLLGGLKLLSITLVG